MKYLLTALFFAFFGCVGVAAGVSIFLPGFQDDRAYLLVLGAPLLFGVATIVVLTRLRLRRRSTTALRVGTTDTTGETCLVIPYSRGLAATYVLICATTLLLFLVIAVASAIALAAPSSNNTALMVQAVVCLGFVVYLVWTVIEMTRKRLTTGAVMLTPNGIQHRSWAFDSYLPWDQAVSVSAGELDGQLITLATYTDAAPQFRRRSRLWKQPEYKLAPHTAIRGMYLTIDPALAMETLRFYHANTAARSELGTEAAVQRIQRGSIS